MPAGGEEQDDDSHGFLRVISAVAKAVDAGSEELQAAEEGVDLVGSGSAKHPRDDDHVESAKQKSDQW